jgi:hypothetical protein
MGLSPTLNHFLAWAKVERQWLAGANVMRLGPPTTSDIDQTIQLVPPEVSGAGTKVIELSFTDAGWFTGYTVENRQLLNGDENLPDLRQQWHDRSPSRAWCAGRGRACAERASGDRHARTKEC